jgi:hypothetical protein
MSFGAGGGSLGLVIEVSPTLLSFPPSRSVVVAPPAELVEFVDVVKLSLLRRRIVVSGYDIVIAITYYHDVCALEDRL